MMPWRSMTLFLAFTGLLLPQDAVWAQAVRVIESTPAPNAAIGGRSSGYSVRFDKPVDHVHSILIIKRGDAVVETLHPRLQSAPDVLFARAPTLPPGQYKLLWQVKTLTDVNVVEGEIPFSVTSGD